MKNWNAMESQATRRILLIACSTALTAAVTVSGPRPAHADRVTPPAVPADIRVQAGNRAFLEGHGVGTQNYICLPCPNATTPATSCPDASGFAWILFTPQATLLADNHKPVTTHFFSVNPNPADNGAIRATWQHSRDLGTVWGGKAIPWRGRALGGMLRGSGRRREGICAVHGRLLLLQGGQRPQVG